MNNFHTIIKNIQNQTTVIPPNGGAINIPTQNRSQNKTILIPYEKPKLFNT